MSAARPLPPHLTPAERAALVEFTASARRLLGPDLLDLRLFGSRARGEGDEDSDVDVALIVTAAGRARRYEVYDLAFDLQLRTGIDIAPSVIELARLEELRARERAIAAAIDDEGVPL
jgi:predicted nucleotidyltransferase